MTIVTRSIGIFTLVTFFVSCYTETKEASEKPHKNFITTLTSEQVTFFLFTRGNPERIINVSNTEGVEPKPVKFIIHGYTDSTNLTWVKNMTEALLRSGDFNVIAVDWKKPAFKLYSISARNTFPLGELIGELIINLFNYRGILPDQVHLIGHSLGAHVAGIASKYVTNKTGYKVRRISGLDVARPLFEIPRAPDDKRLTDQDAEVVECIHTDAEVAGYVNPVGTIDFFPNGGSGLQPNCLKNIHIPHSFKDLQYEVSCSHQMSYIYFTYAVNTGGIEGVECNSYEEFKAGHCDNNRRAIFGGFEPPEERGSYYLNLVVPTNN